MQRRRRKFSAGEGTLGQELEDLDPSHLALCTLTSPSQNRTKNKIHAASLLGGSGIVLEIPRKMSRQVLPLGGLTVQGSAVLYMAMCDN